MVDCSFGQLLHLVYFFFITFVVDITFVVIFFIEFTVDITFGVNLLIHLWLVLHLV